MASAATAGAGKLLVVPLIGLPGAGKSVLAAALAQQLALHVLDRDRVRAALFPACEFTPLEKRAANRAVLGALEANLALGRSSVLDGMTFARRAALAQVERIAQKHGARIVSLWLDLPPAVARARVASDAARAAHAAVDRTPALVDEVQRRFQAPHAGAVRLDASLPPDRVFELALAAIRAA